MNQIVAALFLLLGAGLMLLAALGLLRMPDLPTRMHATTKAGVLGAGLMLLGTAVYFADLGITARALAVMAFIVITAPVAAHLIGRAAYFVGVPLWEKTVVDELKGRYDPHPHTLDSTAAGETNQDADREH